MESYQKNNFHHQTFCHFEEVSPEEILAYQSMYVSRSGSQYYFSSAGVYRISTHWGRVADCRWMLKTKFEYKNQAKKIGFATWDSFYHNNEQMALYYIHYDTRIESISIGHKEDKDYDKKAILRNAKDTQLAIQFIKDIKRNQGWIRYLDKSNPQIILNIIEDIIYHYTDTVTVKKKYLNL